MNKESIENAYGSIEIPSGMEQRVQEKLEKALGEHLRERRLVLRPRPKLLRPLLTAAAAVLLLFVGFSAIRMSQASRVQQVAQIPAARIVNDTEADQQYYPGDGYYLKKYADILDKYRTALAEEADEAACEALGVSPLCRDFYGKDALRQLGYCLDDLNDDGVPELLIGCVDPDPAHEDVILDLYKWYGDGIGTRKVEESTEEQSCYDCGEALLRVERRWRAEPYGMTSWAVYDLTAFKALVGEFSISSVSNRTSLLAPVQPPENGFLSSSEFTEKELSVEEAEAWMQRYCSVTVRHRYTSFDTGKDPTVPIATPEADHLQGMLDEEYRSLLLILSELSGKEEAFALSDYAGGGPDSVVHLLEQIRLLALDRGMTPSQLRGLLLGRLELDGITAEAYAILMGDLYKLDPNSFLTAWHEAGEPSELMQEVTGSLDPAESKLWLREQFVRSKGSMLD